MDISAADSSEVDGSTDKDKGICDNFVWYANP
jgi:hypothetical protein